MIRNDKKYKWCTSCNNGQGVWGFHWKYGHKEWKNKQGKNPSVHFSNLAKNALIYCSYLITTNEDSTEQEPKGADDSQSNDFISLSRFGWIEWLLNRSFSHLVLYFYYFMMSMWPWISLERESCWIWSQRKNSSQCHNFPILVPPRKITNPVKDIYDGQTYDLETRLEIWTRMDVVPVEYGTFAQAFHLTMWFFQFITGITFKWDYVIGRSVALLIWIGLWKKLRIYRVPPDPVRWSCRGFGFIWR